MPTVTLAKIVPYSQKQMYEIVKDANFFTEFVPWCVSSEVLKSNNEEMHICLVFLCGPFHQTITTVNYLQPNKLIEIHLINGPFKKFEGFWRFEDINRNHSRVCMHLDYEPATWLVRITFMPLFHQVLISMVDVVCDRAKKKHGVL